MGDIFLLSQKISIWIGTKLNILSKLLYQCSTLKKPKLGYCKLSE